jgi:hypothetical protein
VFGNSPGSSGIVYRYGISPTSITAYSHPPRLTDVSVIVNRISEPSVTLTKEIDFRVDATNGAIEFREDPFSDPLNISYPVYDSAGNHIDNELQLWMFMADYDWQLLYEQFGYALNVYLESSENYKNLINLLWDSLVQGSTAEHLEYLLAIVSDTPLVIETSETVEVIHTETDRLLIITDRHVYIFGVTATPIVTVGQVLKSGDRMVDAFTIYRPHRDTVPSSVMPSISVGPGVLQGSYASELIFNNRDVELQVTIDPAGRTKIQWELGGIADDVNLFWDTVHFNGTTGSAISLAQLMDTRYPPAQSPDPTAVNLPTTVNPFTFLMTNVFRNNALVVVLNTRSFGTNALGTSTPRGFRQVIPAHNMVFVMVQIVLSDSIIMDGIGDSSSAGYDINVAESFTSAAPEMPLSMNQFGRLVELTREHLTDNTFVYKATSKAGDTCHFGVESAAKAWAKGGTVEAIKVREFKLHSSSPTAAPVGEHELPPLPVTSYQLYYQWSDDEDGCGGSEVVDGDAYTADQMRAYARAALRAGDAVDGPLIDEGSKPALSPLSDKAAIALIEEHTNDENVIHAHEAIDLIRSVERAHGIDAAMRKGQL